MDKSYIHNIYTEKLYVHALRLYKHIPCVAKVTNMSSPRNIAIFGLSIFIGLCVPTWAQKVKNPVQTGAFIQVHKSTDIAFYEMLRRVLNIQCDVC